MARWYGSGEGSDNLVTFPKGGHGWPLSFTGFTVPAGMRIVRVVFGVYLGAAYGSTGTDYVQPLGYALDLSLSSADYGDRTLHEAYGPLHLTQGDWTESAAGVPQHTYLWQTGPELSALSLQTSYGGPGKAAMTIGGSLYLWTRGPNWSAFPKVQFGGQYVLKAFAL